MRGPRFTHTSPLQLRPGLHASCRRSAPRSAPLGAAFCAPGAPRRPPLLPHPRQRRSGSLAPCVRRLSCSLHRRFVRPARGLYATRGALGLRSSAAPRRWGCRGRGHGRAGPGAELAPSPGTSPGDPSTAPNPSSHFLPLGGQRKLKKAVLLRRLPARDFPLGARGGWRSFLPSDEAAAPQKRLEGDRCNAGCPCRVFRQR